LNYIPSISFLLALLKAKSFNIIFPNIKLSGRGLEMALMDNDFDKEKIRELAKKIDGKHIVFSFQFTLKLDKALNYPEFFTNEDVIFMLDDLKSHFFGDARKTSSQMVFSVNEMRGLLNSIKEALRKKELIL
jgi:hypothetical protein